MDKLYDLYFEVVAHVCAPTEDDAVLAIESELETLPDVYQVNCIDVFERHLSADEEENE